MFRFEHFKTVGPWHISVIVECQGKPHVEPEGWAILNHFLCNQPIDPFTLSSINRVKLDATANKTFHLCSKLDHQKIFQVKVMVLHRGIKSDRPVGRQNQSLQMLTGFQNGFEKKNDNIIIPVEL